MGQMYLEGGRYVTAQEARKLRGLDKKEATEPNLGASSEPKKTKTEIMNELTAMGIEFDSKAKKDELAVLLQESIEATAAAAAAAEGEGDSKE